MALVDAEIAKVNAFSERLRVELEAQVDRVRKDHDTWVASGSDEGQARRRRHAPAAPPAQYRYFQPAVPRLSVTSLEETLHEYEMSMQHLSEQRDARRLFSAVEKICAEDAARRAKAKLGMYVDQLPRRSAR